jgi:hypothetical protein
MKILLEINKKDFKPIGFQVHGQWTPHSRWNPTLFQLGGQFWWQILDQHWEYVGRQVYENVDNKTKIF